MLLVKLSKRKLERCWCLLYPLVLLEGLKVHKNWEKIQVQALRVTKVKKAFI